jgi:hypothetical protein
MAAARNKKQRKPHAKVEGVKHRIYRIKLPGNGNTYVPAPPSAKGKKKDSYVHRYMRDISFKRGSTDESNMSKNSLVREAHARASIVVDQTENAINSQSLFECFVLEHMSKKEEQTEYGRYLLQIIEQFDSNGLPKEKDRTKREDALPFLLPSGLEVGAWMDHMFKGRGEDPDAAPDGLEGRGNCSKTIETRIGGLSTTAKQGGNYCSFLALHKDKLNSFRHQEDLEDDRELRAARPFDVGLDLPVLHNAVFAAQCDLQWSHLKRVEFWTTFLAQANVMGRASCVSKYSPKWEDIQFPDKFDSDGFPPYIILKLTQWKQKKSKRDGGKDLEFMIYRNRLDQRFCFIKHFMKMRYTYECIGVNNTKGPIFGHAFGTGENASVNFRHAEKKWFESASKTEGHSHLADCSSHSVRRTFSQWADTCGVDIYRIMEIGRWSDFNTLKKYIDDNKNQFKKSQAIDPNYNPEGLNFWQFNTKVFPAAN